MTATREPHTRHGEAEKIIDQMRDLYVIHEGVFSSLGMLITDATLSRDEVTLHKIHDGLRWMYGHHPNGSHKGRFLGLIDVTYWALRRVG